MPRACEVKQRICHARVTLGVLLRPMAMQSARDAPAPNHSCETARLFGLLVQAVAAVLRIDAHLVHPDREKACLAHAQGMPIHMPVPTECTSQAI